MSVEWPARLICNIEFLPKPDRLGLDAPAPHALDCAKLVRPHRDLEFAENRARAADDAIAGLYRAHTVRCAGVNEIARIKRVELRGEFDETPAIVDQLAGMVFLPDLAVDLDHDRQRVRIGDFVGRRHPRA